MPYGDRGVVAPAIGFAAFTNKRCAGAGVEVCTHWNRFAWRFRILLCGVMPSCRHDGLPFGDDDTWRSARSGNTIPLRAGCIQFRGAWPWLSSSLNLASQHMCFICKATRSLVRPFTDGSLTVAWRGTHETHEEFIGRMPREREFLSQIWSIPGMHLS